jgi:RNA-directed DNA polymerase
MRWGIPAPWPGRMVSRPASWYGGCKPSCTAGGAGVDPARRFGDLFNLVYDPAFLAAAWDRVAANKGAQTAGIDRATVARIEAQVGVVAFLGQIRDSLRSGEFRPVEVRQVRVPKGSSGKFRKLGIPTEAA